MPTPEERFPSGAPKEEFGWMIFEKKSSLGNVLNLSHRPRQLLVEVRRGAGTCDVPHIYQTITAAQPHSSLYTGAVQNSP